jgi:DNA-binding CsgD family transcriptional regulator
MARQRSGEVLASAQDIVARHGVATRMGSRRLAEAWLATAAAYHDRVGGRDDPATWVAVGDRWAALAVPYEIARARWRETEARLGSGTGRAGRADARVPLLEAVTIGLGLGAVPLLRELRELAARALIALPPELEPRLAAREDGPVPVGVMAGVPVPVRPDSGSTSTATALTRALAGEELPARRDTFGLSSREREVLAQIARGRTNREIGERLFISQKTVGVHVGNILAKLGVSGRVEAAAVAIRLGLTDER